MDIKIGYSTCPNDTYIFDAMINGRIDTEDIIFEPYLADVEELNEMAQKGILDVTKMSYHAYGFICHDYAVLDSGSALGWGNGPLLVSKKPMSIEEVDKQRIAIPGELTTANFLMSLAFPHAKRKKAFLFSDIESALLEDKADVGVVIHENRFTYSERGLHLIMDLGAFWEQKTSCPIPLGGIMAHRRLPLKTILKIQSIIRQSILFAIDHPDSPLDYMKEHAQDMREDILRKHVATFVNEYSLTLGDEGQKAILELLNQGSESGVFPPGPHDLFIPAVE